MENFSSTDNQKLGWRPCMVFSRVENWGTVRGDLLKLLGEWCEMFKPFLLEHRFRCEVICSFVLVHNVFCLWVAVVGVQLQMVQFNRDRPPPNDVEHDPRSRRRCGRCLQSLLDSDRFVRRRCFRAQISPSATTITQVGVGPRVDGTPHSIQDRVGHGSTTRGFLDLDGVSISAREHRMTRDVRGAVVEVVCVCKSL